MMSGICRKFDLLISRNVEPLAWLTMSSREEWSSEFTGTLCRPEVPVIWPMA